MASDGRPGPRAGYSETRRPVWTVRDRAAHYREQAAQFQRMAEAETLAAARDRLLELAQQYGRLATKLDADPGVIPDP
jgi:hypothetical protein